MKKLALMACAATTVFAGSASATSLLGETLTFRRLYPNANTDYSVPFAPQTVTVVAGPGDEAVWAPSGPYLTVLPEAATLTFSYSRASGMIGIGSAFDGYSIAGFSFVPDTLQVTSNDTGLTVALSHVGNTLYIDMSGNHNAGNLVLGFAAPPVPEPAAWVLWAAGLAGVGALAGRRQRG